MENKSGSISLTLSWFVATIIVFFIVLGGLFFEGTIIASKKGFSGDNVVSFKGIHDSALEREFLSFLDSEIVFEGVSMRVVDLVADRSLVGNEKYFVEFKNQGDKFLSRFSEWKWFSSSSFSSFTKESMYGASWIRIYDSSEKVERVLSLTNKYGSYDYSSIVQSKGKIAQIKDCDPSFNSVFVEIFISLDKKIAFCMEHKQ